jgi:uncharacterized protein YcnI
MRTGTLSGLRGCGWLAVSTATAFLARAAVYSFAPSGTPLETRLASATGGPSLTLEIVAFALATCASLAIVGTAAVAVAERRRLDPRALSTSPGIEPLQVAKRAVMVFIASSLVFTTIETYVHWRAGLGFHGLRCLTGPVHRDALPFLAALSLLASAVLTAAGHVLAWLRRAIARLVGGVEPVLHERRPRLSPLSNILVTARHRASALGARAPPQHLLVPFAEKNPANKEGERMRVSRTRRAAVLAVTAVGALIAANGAFAHAVLSPPVAKAKTDQVFTLAVPTEEENATTTTVELTPPADFSIDSFAPAAGWKREVQQTGEGEDTAIQKVTWSGGQVPTEEDAVFQFVGSGDLAKTYSFDVRQTYSNGKVVDWSGPESSDTPAPTIEAKSSLGGGSAILPIIALVVGGLGVLLGLAAVFAGRRTLA